MDASSSFNMTTISPGEAFIITVEWRVFLSLIISLLLVASVAANSLTCYIIFRSRRLQSTTNSFIIALSVTSIWGAVLSVLALAAFLHPSWDMHLATCKTAGLTFHAMVAANSFILLSTLVDRYYAIIHPLSFKISKTKAKNLIILSCVSAVILAAPMTYYYDLTQLSNTMLCAPVAKTNNLLSAVPYTLIYICFGYLVPYISSASIFNKIWCYIWTVTQRSGLKGKILRRTTNQVPRAKIKIFKLIAIIVFLEFVSAIIMISTATVFAFHPSARIFDQFILNCFLYLLLAFVKPLVYVVMNGNFRRGCREVLCWSKFRCYRQELYTVTNVSIFARKNYVTAVDANGSITENRWEEPSFFDRSKTFSSQESIIHSARRTNAI